MAAQKIRFIWDARSPMRDGVELSADVYLPEEEGQHPAILQRTPYDNTSPFWVGQAHYFAQNGYAFVSQDVRGRGDSDGKFDPFRDEYQDGFDTVEWVARQPWCNGRIGMMGGSYGGYVQWMAARERPPHLVTLVSSAAAGRWMHELPYMNGKFAPYNMWWFNLTAGRTLQDSVWGLGSPKPIDWDALYRTRPLKDIDKALGRTNTPWRTWLEHSTYDDYWKPLSLEGYFDKIDLPVLHITGWFDDDQWGELYYYNRMIAQSPAAAKQWLLIGPWDHHGTREPSQTLGGVDFGPDSVLDIKVIHLRWFDYWLKDMPNGQEKEPLVKIFIMGRNEWHEAPSWPLPGTRLTEYYFHSGGRANSLDGDGILSTAAPGDEPADSYTYDPDKATPSGLLPNDPNSKAPETADTAEGEQQLDNRYLEQRNDVLVFTSAPLTEELEVTGTSFVTLYAASDCVDTDFMASLSLVQADGASMPLGMAVMRASYRDGSEHPTPITPGQVYKYTIEFLAISMAFQPGQRIRLAVMSAFYPAYDRNPNTGAPVGDDLEVKVAHQTLYHTAAYPSHLLLPVVPRGR